MAVPDVSHLVETLKGTLGYIKDNHDEGCELDPSYGEQNFEANVDHEGEEAEEGGFDDWEPRKWPCDAVCTCGNAEFVTRIERIISSYETSPQ